MSSDIEHHQRVVLLESWKTFEETNGDAEHVTTVQNMFPIVSKKRKVDETGQVVEGEFARIAASQALTIYATDWDMVFADDERESNPTSFKFLQMAHAWAQKRTGGPNPVAAVAPAPNVQSRTATDMDQSPHDGDEDGAYSDDAGSDVASSHGSD